MTRLRGLTWDHARGRAPLPWLTRAFNATPAGRGVRIDWDVQPLSGFESRSLESACAEYDLLVIDHPHVGDAAASGCLVALDGIEDAYVGRSLASYTCDGRLWAVPIDAACHVSAFRASVLSTPPRNWDEVGEHASRAVRIGLPLAGVHALMAWCTLLASQGTPLDEREGWPGTDAMARAAMLLRAVTAAADTRSLHWNPIDALTALAEGSIDYLPLTFGYAGFASDEVRFGPPPACRNDPPPAAILGGTGLAVSAASAHRSAACALAALAGSREIQAHHWARFGGQPAHRAAWDLLATTPSFYRDTRGAVDSAFVRPRFAGWNRLQSRMGDTIHRWLADPAAPTSELDLRLRADWADR